MYATKYDPTAQYNAATQSWCTNQSLSTTQSMSTIQTMRSTKTVSTIQSARGTQSVSTIQATYTTRPMPTAKSPKYIIITGLGKSIAFAFTLVFFVPEQSLINYIRASFPGTYYRLHYTSIPLPIVIQTCDLPACKGCLVDIQPNVWPTIIADIDNIQVLKTFRVFPNRKLRQAWL
ncbi:hypothetical protein ARMGADRAFT_1039617 [Armillaria gallica]|uniref:Uncharacterized protein n=1 Tax=Armillaria gallica TaxID=47427 RepID=A0A2H3CD82_ARMGA|nr:hypothetical protein ARMGADRAFT_1039617 [Armillaria gallica]